MLEFVLFVLIIVVGTWGELCLGRAMQQTGELEKFHPGAMASLLYRALQAEVDLDWRRHDGAGFFFFAAAAFV